ncbi:hypothetical protein ACJX0J_016435 [Zea mays]
MGQSSDDYKGKNLGGTEELDKEDLIFSLQVVDLCFHATFIEDLVKEFHISVNIYNLEAYITLAGINLEYMIAVLHVEDNTREPSTPFLLRNDIVDLKEMRPQYNHAQLFYFFLFFMVVFAIVERVRKKQCFILILIYCFLAIIGSPQKKYFKILWLSIISLFVGYHFKGFSHILNFALISCGT